MLVLQQELAIYIYALVFIFAYGVSFKLSI